MKVSLVSPEKKVWEGEADMVVARSTEGEFAVLTGHIPILAQLIPGRVKIAVQERSETFFVSGGVLEASSAGGYHVIVLADDAENVREISVEEARRRVEEARRLADERAGAREQAALRVALARLELAESHR